jgi:hypothetical protein
MVREIVSTGSPHLLLAHTGVPLQVRWFWWAVLYRLKNSLRSFLLDWEGGGWGKASGSFSTGTIPLYRNQFETKTGRD